MGPKSYRGFREKGPWPAFFCDLLGYLVASPLSFVDMTNINEYDMFPLIFSSRKVAFLCSPFGLPQFPPPPPTHSPLGLCWRRLLVRLRQNQIFSAWLVNGYQICWGMRLRPFLNSTAKMSSDFQAYILVWLWVRRFASRPFSSPPSLPTPGWIKTKGANQRDFAFLINLNNGGGGKPWKLIHTELHTADRCLPCETGFPRRTNTWS